MKYGIIFSVNVKLLDKRNSNTVIFMCNVSHNSQVAHVVYVSCESPHNKAFKTDSQRLAVLV